MLGCFLRGFAVRVLQLSAPSRALRASVTVGFPGAFTAFSTFSLEAIGLIQQERWARAAGYIDGSVALGLAGLVAGLWIATALQRPGGVP